MKKKLSSQGFSLVEVILALGIVSFAIVTLLGLLATGISGLHQSMETSAMAQLAQSLTSEVQMLDYSDVTNSSSTFLQSFSPARYYDMNGQQITTNVSSATYVATLTNSALTNSVPGVTVPANANIGQQLSVQIIDLHTGGVGATNDLCIWAINNGR